MSIESTEYRQNIVKTSKQTIEKLDNTLDQATSKKLGELLNKRNGETITIAGFSYNGQKNDVTLSRSGNKLTISGLFNTAVITKTVNTDSGVDFFTGGKKSSALEPIDFQMTLGQSNEKGYKFTIDTKALLARRDKVIEITPSSSGEVLKREERITSKPILFDENHHTKLNVFLDYAIQWLIKAKK